MNIRPLTNHVIVRRLEQEEKSPGGIIIPERHRQPTLEGVVLAVGPGRIMGNGEREPMELKRGDHVMFGRYGTHDREVKEKVDRKVGAKTILVLREDDVLGVVEG